MKDLVELECKDGGCLEELEAKMKGKPDFVAENQYCKGVGKYCLDDDFCVQEVAKVDFPPGSAASPCTGSSTAGRPRSTPRSCAAT